MKYPKEYLEEIKSRLKVSTVVSRSVNLKKRGKEFIGLSPFTNEKNPSFTISKLNRLLVLLIRNSVISQGTFWVHPKFVGDMILHFIS